MATFHPEVRSPATTLRRVAPLALAGGLLSGCDGAPPVPPPVEEVAELPSPADPGSGEPNLHAGDDGRVYVNWFQEGDGGHHALRLGVLDPERLDPGGGNGNATEPAWEGPRTVVEGEDFFVNWADFPSVARFPDGRLAAHWLVRSGPGPVDYDIHLAWSDDDGRSWSEPVIPHRDGFQTEHGFVSLFPWDDGSLGAAWLDGREIARYQEGDDGDGEPSMTLRFTTYGSDGTLGSDDLLDDRVCDCCPTSAAVTDEGPVVVYRDRSPEEIRDISVVRHRDGEWSSPEPVHEDGWEISACPVNGPAVSAQGRDLATAWYTAADDDPRVLVAFSDDAGGTFRDPVRVDDGSPVGRVAIDLLPSGHALVSWLEETEEGEGAVRVRRLTPEGELGEAETVGLTAASRASGFPRMVRSGDRLFFAWTDPRQEERMVRTAWGRVPSP